MLLLSCAGLCRGFDEGPLFEELGFELFHGDRVGLVGPNGAGKTTLLRLLAGLDQPDRGDVRLHAGARAALLEQQPRFQPGRTLFEEARTALDELVAAQEDLLQVTEQMAAATHEAEHKRLADRYDRLNELLRHHDAYNVDHHVEEVLGGLGFGRADYDRPVETFSGGQHSRLMLARLLLTAPDVMLLDEPSNHLDIQGTKWLEDYLARQNEAMILVSHDRYFLDRVVTRIFELHAGKLSIYPGNYQAYTRLRHERYEREFKTWESQQEYIARQEEYIRRVNYGELHKQAQSRRAALDRLERVPRPTRIEGPHMHFQEVRRSGDVVLEVSDLAKAFDRPLFSGLSFQLQRGKRLGILGPNGSGKTTLLRILLGRERPDSGEARLGHLVDIGYYDQHLDSLDPDKEAIRAAWPESDPDMDEPCMRKLLARFGITGDQAFQKVASLSGGEKSRVALARLVAQNVNLLVLDEPTNHLDLWARESLEEALRAFDGTVIVVSHDRYFLNRVVDLLIVLGPARPLVIHGNYDTYEMMQKPAAAPARFEAAPPEPETRAKGQEPKKRKRRFPFRKVEDLEADIAAAETRLKDLEELLASPGLYREGEKVKPTMDAFAAAKTRLAQLYEHWEEAVELNQR